MQYKASRKSLQIVLKSVHDEFHEEFTFISIFIDIFSDPGLIASLQLLLSYLSINSVENKLWTNRKKIQEQGDHTSLFLANQRHHCVYKFCKIIINNHKRKLTLLIKHHQKRNTCSVKRHNRENLQQCGQGTKDVEYFIQLF